MGDKKNKTLKKKAEADKIASLPWHERYLDFAKRNWKLLTGAIIGISSLWGISTYREQTAEKEKYGELLAYKDKIPELMLWKAKDHYYFQDFLPRLHRENGKFVVNVFIGAPPRARSALLLSEVPEYGKEEVFKGFNYLSEFAIIRQTNDRDNADIRVYCEDNIFPQLGLAGAYMMPERFDAPGWNTLRADMGIMQRTLLINREYVHEPMIVRDTAGHELLHPFGLRHTMNALLELLGKESISGKDYGAPRSQAQEIAARFPQLKDKSILNGGADFERSGSIGEFDRAGLLVVKRKSEEIYGKDYQPPEKLSQETETQIWRDRRDGEKAATPIKQR